MTRDEFLRQLRETLENDLQGAIVQENVDYYNQYISEEIKKGNSEQDVLTALGDPWVLAKTIVDMAGERGPAYQEKVYESSNQQSRESGGANQMHVFGIDTWWKKLLLAVAVVGVLILIFMVVTGILSMLLPLLIPVLVILIIFRLLNRR